MIMSGIKYADRITDKKVYKCTRQIIYQYHKMLKEGIQHGYAYEELIQIYILYELNHELGRWKKRQLLLLVN